MEYRANTHQSSFEELESFVAAGWILLTIEIEQANRNGESLDNCGSVDGKRLGEGEGSRHGNQMAGAAVGQLEFSLQIFLCDLDVAEGHVSGAMA